MHLVDEQEAVPVRTKDDLLAYFATAGKPREAWRIGSEHELIGVIRSTGEAPPYEGPHGIGALLQAFAAKSGDPFVENGHVIAVQRKDAQITIEPGGQFELAARPIVHDAELVSDMRSYVQELAEHSQKLGLAWLACGLRPFGTRANIPWMPKARYDVMRDYMPTVGSRGLDMMQRTATVQVNLDFSDEADAAAKMRCLYSVTPILTALWAASPIVDEKVSGFQSYRSWIWRDTDNARAGLVPFVFDRDDVFDAYTEWALDVPLYFIYRSGYVRVPAGLTFRTFMRDGYEGVRATDSDWALHLSTLFPEGRLKKFIEVRGCDCGSLEMIEALAPMMRGLLYDTTARAAATALTAGLSYEERQRVADDVPRSGLKTRAGKHTLGELAKQLVAIARDGLSRVAPASVPLIAAVEDIASSGRTQSDRIIELWQKHAGNRAALIGALAHPGLA
ncbi:MAG TPA: glutamate-cysteine ligase family protein [Kofleriaceae bacterium]|nr:glutamate-cysteine ligase family protein [Kofleriaceae bacterium]